MEKERETDLQKKFHGVGTRWNLFCVLYRRKNLSLHLRHRFRSFVSIYKDFQLTPLHRTLCFLEEFSASLYGVNYFVFSEKKSFFVNTSSRGERPRGEQNCKYFHMT